MPNIYLPQRYSFSAASGFQISFFFSYCINLIDQVLAMMKWFDKSYRIVWLANLVC